MLASRDIAGAMKWAETLAGTEGVAKAVEAGKSKFAGVEVKGKTLGIIGLGAIGALVANAGVALGMKVIGCDPFMSVDAAWKLDPAVEKAATFAEVFEKADYISLHVPATKDTKGMINAESIATMKNGVRVINLARADLVNNADIKAAIADGKVAKYVTDFPTEETVGVEGIVAIPHLGASTAESEDNCAVMAALQLDDFLRNGNIKNSVNFANVSMARSGDARICVLSAATDTLVADITAAAGVAIVGIASKARGENAYTIIDVNGDASAAVANIAALDSVYRAYAI
jgi:D-3-phosphoglycerate dehydrogenase